MLKTCYKNWSQLYPLALKKKVQLLVNFSEIRNCAVQPHFSQRAALLVD